MTVGIYTGQSIFDKKIKELLKILAKEFPEISPTLLSLAIEDSSKWIEQCYQINPRLKALIFMGTSPSRMIAENWSKEYIFKNLEKFIKRAVKSGIFVIGSTEHTTQTPPEFLKEILRIQLENGIKAFCISDTIGYIRPKGAYRITKFVKKTLKEFKKEDVLIDWHGHNDMDLGIQNAFAAISGGANRVHLVPWGIGERGGNVPLESFVFISAQILKDSKVKNPWNLKILAKLLKTYAKITKNSVPVYGCMGRRAFNTSLGIHAAAIFKLKKLSEEAFKAGYKDLAKKLSFMSRTVYIPADPEKFGRQMKIRISHWSGRHTIELWAKIKKIKNLTPKKIELILKKAKKLQRELTDKEVKNLLDSKRSK